MKGRERREEERREQKEERDKEKEKSVRRVGRIYTYLQLGGDEARCRARL